MLYDLVDDYSSSSCKWYRIRYEALDITRPRLLFIMWCSFSQGHMYQARMNTCCQTYDADAVSFSNLLTRIEGVS